MDFKSRNKITQITIHALAWIVFLTLLNLLLPRPERIDPFKSIVVPDLLFVLFFYINYFILVPQFFMPKKYFWYILICILCLFLTISIPSLISELTRPLAPIPEHMPGPPPGLHGPGFRDPGMQLFPPTGRRIRFFRPEFSYSVLVFLLMLTLSLGFRLLGQWQQAERDKVDAELASLKAQINPHFLFNTLNSIYSLAINKNEKIISAIEMFSDIMRYVIYETRSDFISLSEKLEYINNYISLQKLRLSSNTIIKYSVTGDPGSLRIAPMVIMPFIENAFKHGVSTERDAEIDIAITVEESNLHLSVKNPIFVSEPKQDHNSRLGIENTKKRLDLIYPGRHTLQIKSSETEFVVLLDINLK